jgi:hypothetical protein
MKSPADKEPEAQKAVSELFDACMGFTRYHHGFAMDRLFDAVRSELEKRKTDGDEAETIPYDLSKADDPAFDDVMLHYTIDWLINRYGLETVWKVLEDRPVPEIEQTVGSA